MRTGRVAALAAALAVAVVGGPVGAQAPGEAELGTVSSRMLRQNLGQRLLEGLRPPRMVSTIADRRWDLRASPTDAAPTREAEASADILNAWSWTADYGPGRRRMIASALREAPGAVLIADGTTDAQSRTGPWVVLVVEMAGPGPQAGTALVHYVNGTGDMSAEWAATVPPLADPREGWEFGAEFGYFSPEGKPLLAALQTRYSKAPRSDTGSHRGNAFVHYLGGTLAGGRFVLFIGPAAEVGEYVGFGTRLVEGGASYVDGFNRTWLPVGGVPAEGLPTPDVTCAFTAVTWDERAQTGHAVVSIETQVAPLADGGIPFDVTALLEETSTVESPIIDPVDITRSDDWWRVGIPLIEPGRYRIQIAWNKAARPAGEADDAALQMDLRLAMGVTTFTLPGTLPYRGVVLGDPECGATYGLEATDRVPNGWVAVVVPSEPEVPEGGQQRVEAHACPVDANGQPTVFALGLVAGGCRHLVHVEWKTLDADVGEVSAGGVFTAKAAGSTTVVAEVDQGRQLQSAATTVTVVPAAAPGALLFEDLLLGSPTTVLETFSPSDRLVEQLLDMSPETDIFNMEPDLHRFVPRDRRYHVVLAEPRGERPPTLVELVSHGPGPNGTVVGRMQMPMEDHNGRWRSVHTLTVVDPAVIGALPILTTRRPRDSLELFIAGVPGGRIVASAPDVEDGEATVFDDGPVDQHKSDL